MNNGSQSRSRLVLVQNRAGVSIPFQLDELAQSLLVTGLEPPDTYAIASRFEASLRDERVQEIDSAAGRGDASATSAARWSFACWAHPGSASRPLRRDWRCGSASRG